MSQKPFLLCFHNFSTNNAFRLKMLFIFILTVSGLSHKRQLLEKTVLRNNSVSIFTEDQRHSFCRRDYKLVLRLTPRIVTLKHFTYTRDVFSISSRSHGFSKLKSVFRFLFRYNFFFQFAFEFGLFISMPTIQLVRLKIVTISVNLKVIAWVKKRC